MIIIIIIIVKIIITIIIIINNNHNNNNNNSNKRWRNRNCHRAQCKQDNATLQQHSTRNEHKKLRTQHHGQDHSHGVNGPWSGARFRGCLSFG